MSSYRGQKSSAAPAEKDVYLFLVDADHKSGIISEDYQFIVNKLVADKIFSESFDQVCIRKINNVDTLNFEEVTWNTLRRFKKVANQQHNPSSPGIISSIITGCEATSSHTKNDVYCSKKVLYFGNFNESKFSEADIRKLMAAVDKHDILLTIVFPNDVSCMDSIQENNFAAFNRAFEFSETVFVFTYDKCLGKVLNRVVKKSKKSMPWKVVFDIGGTVKIAVKKLIINRKNTPSFKNEKKEIKQKEIVWTVKDGTVVDESEISTAYLYGDTVVTTGVSEESAYQTGDACLQLLVFCPRENIQHAYLVGDGTDIYLAQEDDQGSHVKLDALIKALHKTNKVAVVRKVWRKNAAAHIGVLVPDQDRKGLIYTDLCFADDISIPHFPPLIKGATGEEIAENDCVIDKLIAKKAISEFFPEEGPVDPAEQILRQQVINKLINNLEGNSTQSELQKPHDSLELFFENVIVSKELTEKIHEAFPLVSVQTRESDRPSGPQVFRKRPVKAESNTNEDKKAKLDTTVSAATSDHEADPAQDVDSLLDDL